MKQIRPKPVPKQKRLGFVAGLLLGRGRKKKMTPHQLRQQDFKTSTQRLGIRFSDHLRGAFRRSWLKIK